MFSEILKTECEQAKVFWEEFYKVCVTNIKIAGSFNRINNKSFEDNIRFLMHSACPLEVINFNVRHPPSSSFCPRKPAKSGISWSI